MFYYMLIFHIQGFQSQISKEGMKTKSNIYSKGSLSYQLMLCILYQYIVPKHYTHIIFVRRWNTRPNDVIKVANGLPHMCPCHQLNWKRGLVMYKRWITTEPNCCLCHTTIQGNIVHFVSKHTQTILDYVTMFFSHFVWLKNETLSLRLPHVRTLLL